MLTVNTVKGHNHGLRSCRDRLSGEGGNMRTIDKVKKGIECCTDISECKYKTKDNCPYRLTEITCGRIQMMQDIALVIKELEETIEAHDEMIRNARIALDANCDDCDRW